MRPHRLAKPATALQRPLARFVRRCCIVLFLASSAVYAWEPAGPAEQKKAAPEGGYQRPIIIRLEGTITPFMGAFFERKIADAKRRNADLIIVEWDSPGGYLHTSLEMAATLRDIHWARTVAYVPKMALSGAAIVSLGCDDLVMSKNAVFGDAGPIVQEWEEGAFRHAPEKVRSDLVRRVRDLAESKDRPPGLAEAMVNMNVEVFRCENKKTGAIDFLTDTDLQTATDSEDWVKGKLVAESRKEHFLEVNGKRAVELHLGVANAESREELAQYYKLAEPPRVIQRNTVDTVVLVLNSPLVTILLFIVGLVALYLEASAPGIGFGGLLAGLCFLLFFWSRVLGGTAGILEIILFFSGVGFLAMEFFVIPGFGVTGISGILLILTSLLLATQDFVFPSTTRQLDTMIWSASSVLGGFLATIVLAVFAGRHLHRLPLLSQLTLQAPSDEPTSTVAKDGSVKDLPPPPPFAVGDWGVANSALRPAGRALFGDQYVDVVADGQFVEVGSQVRIVGITGNRIVVREVDA